MDIGSLFLILALFILVILFITRPLFEHRSVSVSPEEQQLSTLLAERDRTLNAIQELDFDYKLGKIPEEDYPAQRMAMLKHGADILHQLDAYQVQPAPHSTEDRLEAAIASRAALAAAAAGSQVSRRGVGGDDELETVIANRRRSRSEKSAGFCFKCGGPVQISDRFCPKCGTVLNGKS